jgi:hypothetical protein
MWQTCANVGFMGRRNKINSWLYWSEWPRDSLYAGADEWQVFCSGKGSLSWHTFQNPHLPLVFSHITKSLRKENQITQYSVDWRVCVCEMYSILLSNYLSALLLRFHDSHPFKLFIFIFCVQDYSENFQYYDLEVNIILVCLNFGKFLFLLQFWIITILGAQIPYFRPLFPLKICWKLCYDFDVLPLYANFSSLSPYCLQYLCHILYANFSL